MHSSNCLAIVAITLCGSFLACSSSEESTSPPATDSGASAETTSDGSAADSDGSADDARDGAADGADAPGDSKSDGAVSDGDADADGASDGAADVADTSACGPSSCDTRLCGPSPCGYDCGKCGAGKCCNLSSITTTACSDIGTGATTCTNVSGGIVCYGAKGFRACPSDPTKKQVCSCTPDGWSGCDAACI